MSRRVLDVGQCGYDHGQISRAIESEFDATVSAAHSGPDALAQLRDGTFDLVLINRLLDRDGSSGMDILGKIKADPALAAIPVMLVSNYADAQSAAVAAGAVAGFGKNDLRSTVALDKVRPYLQQRGDGSRPGGS